MKIRKIASLAICMMLFSLLTVGCKKDQKTNPSSSGNSTPAVSKEVTYELTGNYSGKLTIIFSDESGNSQTLTFTTLPWKKTFTVKEGVSTATLTANTTATSTLGSAGQTLKATISVNNVIKKEHIVTSDQNGHVTTGSLSVML